MADRKKSKLTRQLRAAQAELAAVRLAGWLVLGGELAVLLVVGRVVVERSSLWLPYLGSLALVLAVYHGLPRALERWATDYQAEVSSQGDRWRIGKYSESRVRRLLDEVTLGLPARLQRVRLRIADRRDTSAWTFLRLLWPGGARRRTIVLTSGLLHYLEPEELKAVILHELGHHQPSCRAHVPGGWPLADITLHAAAFWIFAFSQQITAPVTLFLMVRPCLALFVGLTSLKRGRMVEHLCDRFAASRIGSSAMINALLKTGEDEELAEAVLVWMARDLVCVEEIDIDDLILALHEARPYGRIFHDNLIRHAAEATEVLLRTSSPTKRSSKRQRENPVIREFIEQRRARRRHRVRWRRFDGDGDGVLTPDEIVRLCDALHAHPDYLLVHTHGEVAPTTHPPYRDRVLLLCETCSPLCDCATTSK